MARETYAAAMVDAATHGFKVSPIDPWFYRAPAAHNKNDLAHAETMASAIETVDQLEQLAKGLSGVATDRSPRGSVNQFVNHEMTWWTAVTGGSQKFSHASMFVCLCWP